MAERDGAPLSSTADALLERERRARELSEERLARVQRIAKVGSWEWDLVRQHLSWSDEIYRIFDLGRDAEPTFDGIVALIHPEDRATHQAFVEQLLSGADHAALHFRVLLPDGRVRYVHQHAEVHRDAAGAPAVVFGTMQDVTEAKRAEEVSRVQAMLLASQSEAAIDGILNVDPEAKIIWWNRRFAEMWGVPEELLRSGVDEPVLRLVQSRVLEPDAFAAKVSDLYARRDAKSRDELALKDGRLFDRFTAPVTDEQGSYLGRIWLFRDVTEERRLQATVAQADRLASMGMLAAGVAHEINNPLSYVLYNLTSLAGEMPRHARRLAEARNALRGSVGEAGLRELLGDNIDVLDPATATDAEERFRDALTGVHRIKDIVRGLGTFSRAEQDRLAPVDLRYPIECALNIAFNEIKYRARIVKDFCTSSSVMASDGRLSQVFLNLLINAAHAIAEGDVEHNKISVRTWQEGGEVLAEVLDTGAGIGPENLERIFEPFYSTKSVGVGSGLGLSIVRNIVTSYGGAIEVTSEVGKGSRFVIRFPVAAAVAAGTKAGTAQARGVPAVAGRVLVIDDEPAIRGALRRILRAHEVVEADSGERARELLAADQGFDVILCDMMMPNVSGVDVHKWLLAEHPELARKLVFVTGGAFTPNARQYLEQVDNVRVEKPFDATNLEKQVNEWVSASRAKR
jgi:two-component system, cell cycle sensor histidine kinase and response regulator CckA